jgi:hypothetical protein
MFSGSNGKEYHVAEPFREVTRCWSDVSHWKVHEYHVLSQDEVMRDPGRFGFLDGRGLGSISDKERDLFELKRMWDASIRVDVTRLIKIVRQALERGGARAGVDLRTSLPISR